MTRYIWILHIDTVASCFPIGAELSQPTNVMHLNGCYMILLGDCEFGKDF